MTCIFYNVSNQNKSWTFVAFRSIYSTIIEGHLQQGSFTAEVVALGPKLVDAMIELHANVLNTFLPSATKFHYQFNLRELSAITQVTSFCSLEKLLFFLRRQLLQKHAYIFEAYSDLRNNGFDCERTACCHIPC